MLKKKKKTEGLHIFMRIEKSCDKFLRPFFSPTQYKCSGIHFLLYTRLSGKIYIYKRRKGLMRLYSLVEAVFSRPICVQFGDCRYTDIFSAMLNHPNLTCCEMML